MREPRENVIFLNLEISLSVYAANSGRTSLFYNIWKNYKIRPGSLFPKYYKNC